MSSPLTLKVKRLVKDAKLPTKAHQTDAAFDFYWCPKIKNRTPMPLASKGQETLVELETGIALEIPPGYFILLHERSGMAKQGVTLVGGVIDADYRGEIIIFLQGPYSPLYGLKAGDRVAQGLLLPVPEVEVVESEELSETGRGTSGFGSTGK
jgi:dUTP pyrophosphatase